ncbi:MAG: hypothetical protein NWQ21_02740 [Desulfobacterales bacterium]|jgi:rRNA-processing protein FCF1|nr:hypothetical protein [Desulfobacterales bacterium]MDP4978348.1 hypothetical protein [Desulfobacterales bacterium]
MVAQNQATIETITDETLRYTINEYRLILTNDKEITLDLRKTDKLSNFVFL